MEIIRHYDRDTDEYQKIASVADAMNRRSTNGVRYTVGDTYFDFGQNWMWTTILATKPDGDGWQVLYPADLKKILYGGSPEDIARSIMSRSDLYTRGY